MEKIWDYIIGVVFVISILLAGVQTYRLDKYREQCEYYRTEYSATAERFGDITNVIGRTSESLNISANTIAELRGQITEVRIAFEEMENIIADYDTNRNNLNNDTNFDRSK